MHPCTPSVDTCMHEWLAAWMYALLLCVPRKNMLPGCHDLRLQVLSSITWRSEDLRNATLSTCGRLWVSTDGGAAFAPTTHNTYRVSPAASAGSGTNCSWLVRVLAVDNNWHHNVGGILEGRLLQVDTFTVLFWPGCGAVTGNKG
jgi:hypothetical protein